MKSAVIEVPGGLENLAIVERDRPVPGPADVLVRVQASSLNYHDYVVATGGIQTRGPRVLMSDGAGEVVAAGSEVADLRVGVKVISTFFPNWADGPQTNAKRAAVPGDSIDGFASEYVVAPASALTRAPRGYSHAEAATLPCAALTAWRALMVEARIRPGDVVLTIGTGGVSIFALQFALAAGAQVVSTSSSDAKLERLRALGASHVINYRKEPSWGRAARQWTGGRGVDAVVEVGGPQTLRQSISACRVGGHISMVGVLTGVTGEVPTAKFFQSNLTMTGITVGSRQDQQDQQDMIRAIEANDIRPVIDRTFALDQLADAFRFQESGGHFGKIGLEL